MKRNLVLFLILGLMVTGCNEKKEEVNDNIDNGNTTGEVENNGQTVAPSCTPKKFSQTYTYAYTTKEECISKANTFLDVSDNIDSTIFTYGCEEIVDECGTTWYGVYFNRWSENGGDEVTRLYY